MRYSQSFLDYKIIDTSNGEKLEKWGKYILVRPDPQVIWETPRNNIAWKNPDGRYIRSSTGGGQWENNHLPEVWSVSYKNYKFNLKPMGFKHTGLFPEQAVNWDWMSEKIKKSERKISVLNLFAYTGGATVACAAAGAEVVHVDSSKGMVNWAKENLAVSGLSEMPVRFIVDDCIKFVQREIRRGKKYDAIIMDPPSYGRGPSGEIWKIEEQIYDLLRICADVLSDAPLFFMLNSYTTGLSPSVMAYLLGVTVGNRYKGLISADEIGLMVEQTGLVLPCGATAIWESKV
jgi:23S rRNA (cytosine1962-C5)-methyltransferase